MTETKSDETYRQKGIAFVGYMLVLGGTIFGAIGAIVNAMGAHKPAFLIWAVSNPMLLAWALGAKYEKWDYGLSYGMLAFMYLVFIIGNLYALETQVFC